MLKGDHCENNKNFVFVAQHLFLANCFTTIIPVEAKRALECFRKEHPGKPEMANKK
jgi:hypothetical protein